MARVLGFGWFPPCGLAGASALGVDGSFGAALAPPHVAPGASITIQSTASILTARAPATHVSFTLTFSDDAGQTETAAAEADISRTGQ